MDILSFVVGANNGGTEYVAGDNIQIEGNVISATDTTYSAGAGIIISDDNEITYDAEEVANVEYVDASINDTMSYVMDNYQRKVIAGNNISVAADGKTISATDTTYSAGSGISIDSNNVISVNISSASGELF